MTLGLLAALRKRGMRVQGFKCGPDYIDPMYHAAATGRTAYHLDSFFSDEEQLRQLTAQHAADAEIAVIEGAMGFYDGIGDSWAHSAYTVSEQTETPVLLVLDPGGMGCSAAALCQGLQQFVRPNRICGVLLNRVRHGMYSYYKGIIETHTGLHVYGYLPDLPEVTLKSRHLGLLTAAETADLAEKLEKIGSAAEKTLDIEDILTLAAQAPPLSYAVMPHSTCKRYRLGIAQDAAFCFYYAENLESLQACGAELIPFSPLTDTCLPDALDGLYFGGGYPELYCSQLSENQSFIESLRCAVRAGIPTFAECGGFLYLQQAILDKSGGRWPMAGVLPGESRLTDRLVRFGYVTLTAQQDTLLLAKGETVCAHEFHYADSTDNGTAFLAEKPNGRSWEAIVQQGNVMAGFPHLYFPSCPQAARRLSEACLKFQKSPNR